MKITLKMDKPNKNGFLSKAIFALLGVFATSTIFAFLIQLLHTWGVWLGILAHIAIITAIFHFTKPKTWPRLIIWGMLATVVLVTIVYFTGLSYIKDSLEGF